jgi:hypothetical protein
MVTGTEAAFKKLAKGTLTVVVCTGVPLLADVMVPVLSTVMLALVYDPAVTPLGASLTCPLTPATPLRNEATLDFKLLIVTHKHWKKKSMHLGLVWWVVLHFVGGITLTAITTIHALFGPLLVIFLALVFELANERNRRRPEGRPQPYTPTGASLRQD